MDVIRNISAAGADVKLVRAVVDELVMMLKVVSPLSVPLRVLPCGAINATRPKAFVAISCHKFCTPVPFIPQNARNPKHLIP